jgi:hypothetical protein
MPFAKPLESLSDAETFDVVVVGAGGAGLSAALFAAIAGAKVLVVESTDQVGGTTAYSTGTHWIAGTHLARQVNPEDTQQAAERYLDAAVGERSPASMRRAFLDHGPQAVKTLDEHSHVKYQVSPFDPDCLSELPGATLRGRALAPLPFDGRLLKEDFALVRPPVLESMVLGGMMVDRNDIAHLLGYRRSFKSARHVAGLLARHALDRLRHKRGTRLLMGNALVGRLLLSLKERGVTLVLSAQIMSLERETSATQSAPPTGAVRTVKLQSSAGVVRRVLVRGGVVLASGGFNRHPERRSQWLPQAPQHWCAGAPGHAGQAQGVAMRAGAAHGAMGPSATGFDRSVGQLLSPAFWAPVSWRQRADGSTTVFPHVVFDLAKPGTVVVDGHAKRFANESASRHLFALAMRELQAKDEPTVPAYLITDAHGMDRYGLGIVRPKGMGLQSALNDGYVIGAESLEGLAQTLRLPLDPLKQTIERFNLHGFLGFDPDFGRGTTAYERAQGDPSWPGPNPCLGPIRTPPFYALKLVPGDVGAAAGLVTDTDARMLDARGQVIDGLYAVGNDMQSVMGGVHAGPGSTLGPGLVFAYLAARHAAARAAPSHTTRLSV